MLLIGSKWRYGSVPEGCDFLVSQERSVRWSEASRAAVPKNPGPQRGAVTPMGADQKHSALFRSIRVKSFVVSSLAKREYKLR
jgi:hypothetical protein